MKAERPITRSLKRSRKALMVIVVKEVTSGQIWYIFPRWRQQKLEMGWMI